MSLLKRALGRTVLQDKPNAAVSNETIPEYLEELQRRVNSLPWHHQIDFGNGVLAPGNTPIEVLQAQAAIYFDRIVHGKTFLDIGAWDGFNSFEAFNRGASRVLATDHFAWSDQCWGKREAFELARAHLAPAVEVLDIDLPELSSESVGAFDVVLFAGVFYHLRHPFAVLEQVSTLAKEWLIVETHLDALDYGRPAMVFYPTNELANDHTNWWGPNPTCVIAMLKDVGFTTVEFIVHPFHSNRGIFRAHRQ
ncbi:methyltransferase type 11 [Phyllobacterium brassicacearum]|uniref:Methyltransferase type 11 n=1 Tax=Phyllobacterium brassicacearum TaxID=314235 RepID=A0A2P7BBD3_9HYPH|nr:DUF1698 domain-containing protein [Phyllobacterium brassicacearum]PSH63742.1 methyltransferase type 11 [Phyllobacterium brassicacearum]TDQ31976.1 tRNA (mo5U34)-methyltransferase [Phyllobacterium brassicacearum]